MCLYDNRIETTFWYFYIRIFLLSTLHSLFICIMHYIACLHYSWFIIWGHFQPCPLGYHFLTHAVPLVVSFISTRKQNVIPKTLLHWTRTTSNKEAFIAEKFTCCYTARSSSYNVISQQKYLQIFLSHLRLQQPDLNPLYGFQQKKLIHSLGLWTLLWVILCVKLKNYRITMCLIN